MNTEQALEAIGKLNTDQQHLLGLVCIGRCPEVSHQPNWEEDIAYLVGKDLILIDEKLGEGYRLGYTIPVHIAWCQWCTEQVGSDE